MGDLRKSAMALAGSQNQIVIPRAFVEFTGSLEAGMLLNQILFWSSDGKNGRARCGPDGWIAKSDRAWSEELCLSTYAVRKAAATLSDMGVIETKKAQWNGGPTLHYRLSDPGFENAWLLWIRKNDIAKTEERSSEKATSIIETTLETTIENVPPSVVPPAALDDPEPTNGKGPIPDVGSKPTHGAMFTALAEVCHADKKIMGGRLNRSAKDILHAECPGTPEEVRAYFGPGGIYWAAHWKGRKGEPPMPEDVANWLKQAREAVRARVEVETSRAQGAGEW